LVCWLVHECVTFHIIPVRSKAHGNPNGYGTTAPDGATVLTSLSPTLAIYRVFPSGLNAKPVGLKFPSAVLSVRKSLACMVLGSNTMTLCPIICPITDPTLIPNLELAVKCVCGASVPNSPINAIPLNPNLLLFEIAICVSAAPTSTTSDGFSAGGSF